MLPKLYVLIHVKKLLAFVMFKSFIYLKIKSFKWVFRILKPQTTSKYITFEKVPNRYYLIVISI